MNAQDSTQGLVSQAAASRDPRLNPIDARRLGEFSIDDIELREEFSVCLKVFQHYGIIVLRCEHDYASGRLMYTAASEHFAVVEPGCMPNHYCLRKFRVRTEVPSQIEGVMDVHFHLSSIEFVQCERGPRTTPGDFVVIVDAPDSPATTPAQ